MQIHLRDVEYFAAIAEHGQVQRAAAALGLSQPALSKGLRRLEQAMNAKLLKRTPKGVELTAVGSALLAQLGKLRMAQDDVMREIVDLSEGRAGHLRIGSAGGPTVYLVPAVCAKLLDEAPSITVSIAVDDTLRILAGLRNGQLDLAIPLLQGPPPEDMVVEHTHEEAYVVYVSANHRLAKRRQLTLADLAGERWVLPAPDSFIVRLLTERLASAALPPPRIAVDTTNLLTRHALVAATDLVGVGTRAEVQLATARLPIVGLRVKDFGLIRRGGVMYRKDAYLSPVARRFVEILKATAKEIGK